MNREQWARIEAIFNEASQLPESQRARFIEGACAGDSALRREVESLIEKAELPEEADRERIHDAVADAASELHKPIVGRTVGRYRFLEFLGQGGMGEVYRAEDMPLKRNAAIKIISPE